MRSAFVAVFALASASCQSAEQQGAAQGLADCGRVSETLASFQLGTATSGSAAERRAPIVAAHSAACKAARVTRSEAECLRTARDTWAARACMPSMFPPAHDNGDCNEVAARMRQTLVPKLGSATESIDKMLPAVRVSCEHDQWPAEIKRCIIATQPGDVAAFSKCAEQLPKQLQDQLAQRMLALSQHAPTP